MEGFERPSPQALEQSLLAVAHRNLLGIARGKDHACGIPLFRMGASRGVVAISAVGWADGPRDSQVERILARTTRGEPSQGSPTVWLLGSAFVRRTSWSAGGLRAAQAGREARRTCVSQQNQYFVVWVGGEPATGTSVPALRRESALAPAKAFDSRPGVTTAYELLWR